MKTIIKLILVFFATNSFAQTNSSIGRNELGNGSVYSGKDSTSRFVNVPCITSACTTTNTGSSFTIGTPCNPNNPSMDSAPVTDYYECKWNGSGWIYGSNINAACGNSGCSPAYLEWADKTTIKKCDGSVRSQIDNFSRCEFNGEETCTMTWSDGTISYVPGDKASVDSGTNYISGYTSSYVMGPGVCNPEKRFCVDNPSGGGFLTGSATYKNCVVRYNGGCGSSNGENFTTEPTTGLCNSGIPTSVTNGLNWSWSCLGINGGANASCAAAKPFPVIAKFGVNPSWAVHAHHSGNRMRDNWTHYFSLDVNPSTGKFTATNSYTYVFRLYGDRGSCPFVEYTAKIDPSSGNISIGVDDGGSFSFTTDEFGNFIFSDRCAIVGPKETAVFSGGSQIYNSGLYYINN